MYSLSNKQQLTEHNSKIYLMTPAFFQIIAFEEVKSARFPLSAPAKYLHLTSVSDTNDKQRRPFW